MYPILLQLGPITIYTFGVIICVGFILALFFLKLTATQTGLRFAFIVDYLFTIALASIVTGRIVHVLLTWELYEHQLRHALYVWDGQISLIGAIIGGAVAFYYVCLRHQQPFLLWMDTVMVGFLTLFSFGYLGLFFSEAGASGQALGVPTTLPWGITMNFLSSPYAGTPVHPIALYMSFASALGAVAVMWLKFKQPQIPAGILFFGSLSLFMAMLALTELLRWETEYTIRGHNVTLTAALLLAILSIAGLIIRIWKIKSSRPRAQKQDQVLQAVSN